ncbi:MAG: hypothetical protein WCS94_25665, partial [Verrucomicrobiota bacterium]
ETAVFLVFGFVSAQLQGFQTCVFAKASPKIKNPRRPSLHLFCQCSNSRSEAPRSEGEASPEFVILSACAKIPGQCLMDA